MAEGMAKSGLEEVTRNSLIASMNESAKHKSF